MLKTPKKSIFLQKKSQHILFSLARFFLRLFGSLAEFKTVAPKFIPKKICKGAKSALDSFLETPGTSTNCYNLES